ncbi:HNH endonuclease [Tenacibaculum soleae]|uniref:HNH endonuclease n=1 Tax=Tenacibaculum soleae TaxID=447689 RepID=UPI002300D332|nr:HNH endonuclease [Tenacibaculum soleae]
MIRNYRNEKWKEIVFDNKIAEKEKFKISNYGRILNCKNKEESLVNEYFINGYQNLPLKQRVNGKNTSRYVHKLVAEAFLERNEDQLYVIHLNYDKKDNRVENLKWATKREKEVHQYTNPEYVNKVHKARTSKLTETKVKFLKRKLNDPNRRTRLKILARQFGVSEMQLHRIKTGENWGYVTED